MAKFDDIINATLNKDNTISVHVHKSYTTLYTKHFYLYCDDVRVCELNIQDQRETPNHFHYVLNELPPINIGSEYRIYDDRYLSCFLNLNVLLQNDKICNQYFCDDVMGAHYHKFYTTFRLFSPLATHAYAVYIKEGKEYILALEKNVDNGTFQGRASGDLGRCEYYFMVRINGELVTTNDPYAKAITVQSTRGVIVDPREVTIDLNEEALGEFESVNDAIIYEMSVRDFTSFKNTSIIHKGKFLGVGETARKSKHNNPVGLDYLKYLGVTHVQLMPIYDFCTGCDINQQEAYNWGYDPLFYNVPEGSYASDPVDPYSRIIDLKKMVASLHKAGIRVVMDVVFNHVFNLESSSFEKICPSYYFRYKEDGKPSNGSFCGNEFNSSHKMARKFIVDSCLYWVKEFGIDGFRFDLMGLIDIDTITEVKEKCEAIKKNFLVYGEGWDMPSVLHTNLKTSLNNAQRLPQIGFFNDRFRDIVKGKSGDYDLWVKGYLLGDVNYIDGFKHCFIGSCLPLAFPPLFTQPSQSINFVECHDNATLIDKLQISNSFENNTIQMKRIKLLNACTILSYGIPFIHCGQEIGQSKRGVYNSYNAGDEINQFNYDLMDQRFDLVNYIRDLIKIKKFYPFFRLSDKKTISETIDFKNLHNGALLIKYTGDKVFPCHEVNVIINPNVTSFEYNFSKEFQVIFNDFGKIDNAKKITSLTIEPVSLVIAIN